MRIITHMALRSEDSGLGLHLLTLKRIVTQAHDVHLAEGSLQHLRKIRFGGRSYRFRREPDEDPTNTRPGGTPSGQAHLGLPKARQAS